MDNKSQKNTTDSVVEVKDPYQRMAKKKMINIRMHHEDVKKIQQKAVSLGMPYQTLIGCILHLYAHDKIDLEL